MVEKSDDPEIYSIEVKEFIRKKRAWVRSYLLEPYFCFFSRIFLARWRPEVIVITGTVGKTSLLHLLAEQLGDDFIYSRRSNSKIGITLNMLGVAAISPHGRWRWLLLILLVPLKAFFEPTPKQKKYLVEYDAYDPTSSKFFKWWLRPRFVVWLTVSEAHTENFDRRASLRKKTPLTLMIEEFRSIAVSASELIFAPASSRDIKRALKGCAIPVEWVSSVAPDYSATPQATIFKLRSAEFIFSHPLPESFGQTLVIMEALVKRLGYSVKHDLRSWTPPPGRNTLLRGVKGSYLIDSSYNAQIESVLAVLDMFKQFEAPKKWLVFGGLLEQGSATAKSHERLAKALAKFKADRLFLVGPRTKKHICPALRRAKVDFHHVDQIDKSFLNLLLREITGSEAILFKGSGFLGALVEALLADETDRQLLDTPGRNMQMLK